MQNHRHISKSPELILRAKDLRKQQTPAEARLWGQLRNRRLYGYKFKRQTVIGNFIADFSCAETRLIIEVDGSQHGNQVEYDQSRTAFFEENGYKLIRFWNAEVLQDLDGVLERITNALSPTLPQEGREK
ncbi:MAG: endonuclease domain-containing protein [Anaerolinea sp.]|nr:endonuclease domain-containing protein [Anaerolinea sp.]